jgi:hypothetical protein
MPTGLREHLPPGPPPLHRRRAPKHNHDNITADDIYTYILSCLWLRCVFSTYCSREKAAKTARAGPGSRPPPNRPGAPNHDLRRNRFGLLNGPGRPSGANLPSATGALMFKKKPRPQLPPLPDDRPLGPSFTCSAYGHTQKAAARMRLSSLASIRIFA